MGKTIGVLALQGGFEAHAKILRGLGHAVREVRAAADLTDGGGLDGLVFPGGESSTMLKLIGFSGLWEPLDAFVRGGHPVLATCAGMILAATGVSGPEQASFGWLDVDVTRNGWGRQVHSFEAVSDDGAVRLVFIRAPRLTRIGAGVTVLHRFEGEPITVRQGNVVAASFHPELADEPALHAIAFGG
ncbi:MAG: pyridoxal 5'-phosphate synthase glutaminase subunit PdxT [Deltaproteobacteria bacterium HGW-Deltaproteobacteria-14]|jgi:5'-phosphate synthase pdxT subunit|nr:MAG: pyridoxal 5'-phosphate synthase glutaminase subunit PdxT [Deltaproteobacteria bacterium HGW-Deltaproteobacteria-14]